MCERTTKQGSACERASRYYVLIHTVPQPLGPDGAYGVEGPNASRSVCVCAAHLARAVSELNALPIARYNATAQVREI